MGWFVGRERLTGQAYKELVKDDLFPLTITPETLLHLLTATRRDSPSHVADVAKILSSEMQCTAFLAIATKYPPEEIASFMEVFNRKLTPKEVSFLTSLDNRIVYLPDGVQDSRATDEIQQWVRDFSGANAGRHDARARREARMRRARDENLAQNKSEREAAQDEISRLEDEIDDLKREVVLGKKRIERLRRAIVATTISATGLLGVVLVHLIAKLSGPPVALAYTSEAAASLLAVRYALDPNVSGMWLVTTEFSTFALAVIATLLTQILS
jgi:hypothetical protein